LIVIRSNTLRRFLTAACIIAGLCAVLAAHCSAESVSDYKRLLASASDSVRSAITMERDRPGSSQALLDELYANTPSEVKVETADGSFIKARLSWLRADIRRSKSAKGKQRITLLQSLAVRIEAAGSVVRDSGTPNPALRALADAKLKQVLAGREYQPSVVDDFRSSIMRAISEWLGGLFRVSPSTVRGIGWVVFGFVVIGFVAALVFVVLRLVAYYSYPKSESETAGSTRITRKQVPSPISAIQAAEKHAAAGRYREAFRGIYLAAILVLDRAKLIKYTDGTTNWEYLRWLARQPKEQPVEVFREMTTSFDDLIYGKKEVSREDYANSAEHFKQLEEVL